MDRIKKVFDLKGQRLEPEDLRRYKKNLEEYIWSIPNELPKLRIVYNNEKINILRKREIKELKKETKNIDSSYKKEIKAKKTRIEFKKKIKQICPLVMPFL